MSVPGKLHILWFLSLLLVEVASVTATEAPPSNGANRFAEEGIRFSCPPDQLARIESDMAAYMADLGISSDLVVTKSDPENGNVVFTLRTAAADTDTLGLRARTEFGIRDELVSLPAKGGRMRSVLTVSKKEVLLAMLQHGRLTEFEGASCRLDALKDAIGIRQNTVAWAERMELHWPNGGPARWNLRYWTNGVPKDGIPLHVALNDVFDNPHKYSLGCYAAAKIVMIQGVLDYYRRIRKDHATEKTIEDRLWADGEPLLGVEPGAMWSFEPDFEPTEAARPGKILEMVDGVTPKNVIPGDWVHLTNTGGAWTRTIGYEGANPIYLGRNRVADYFNDSGRHYFTFEEKLDEVYQWRNGVFSRSRDAAKIRPLSAGEMNGLRRTPAEGGILMDRRLFHSVFRVGASPE